MMSKMFLVIAAAILVYQNIGAQCSAVWPRVKGSNLTENGIVILQGNCSTVYQRDIVVNETVELKAIPLFRRDHEVTWKGDQTIVCITVFQLKNNGHPGDVRITDGGIGHKYIDIKMESDRGHGLHLLAYVYAQWK